MASSSSARTRNANSAAGRSEFNGVVEQVVNRLANPARITHDASLGAQARFEFDAAFFGDAAKHFDALLDQAVEALCAKILLTFPDCFTKTLEELRKPKLKAWNDNKENSRAWLALNMMTEARAGFRAFNEGTRDDREIDFVALRQALAAGSPWTPELTESLLPAARAGR
mgnify:CR=1 FL=1